MSSDDLVWVNLHFEGPALGSDVDEYLSIPRAEWEAMTEVERDAWIAEELDTFVSNQASWSGEVVDAADPEAF